jgi:hypothetical protein
VSTTTCPNGHTTSATDYCDTCGAPVANGAGGVRPAAPDVAAARTATPAPDAGSGAPSAPSVTCANCQTVNLPDALFCEACGYDFTTGAMPRAAAPASSLELDAAAAAAPDPDAPPLAPPVPFEWVVEVWVDPDWYAEQESDEPCPSPGLPVVVPLTVRSVLVGRTSKSRNIHPEVDCGADIGVSRRQAQLSTDGSRWWIEDLQSSNNTYVGPASGPLPTEPLPAGQRRELAEDDRIYVGAWTRLVVRKATDEEKAGAA